MAAAVREGIAGLAADWDDLALRVGARPWHRPGWFEAWTNAFGGELQPLTVRRDGRLVALLPLLADGRAPVNWHTPSLALLAEDDDARGALLDAAAEARRLRLPLLEDGAEVAGELGARGLLTATRTQLRSPYVELALPHGVGKKRRKNIERSLRKLAPALDIRTDAAALPEGLELERSGWKSGTAIADDPVLLRFYTEIARWAEREGILRLCFLRVGDAALAFEFALEDARAFAYLKGGYDTAYREHSPGFLIAHELTAYARDRGLETFEFLGDAEPFKLEWTDRVRERVLVDAFPRTPIGFARRALEAHGRPLAKKLLRR